MGGPHLGQQIGLGVKRGHTVCVEAPWCMAAVSPLLLPLRFGSDALAGAGLLPCCED